MRNAISIYGFDNSIAYCEAKGLSKCFAAYADNATGEDIMEVGFNPNSGYTYIALENGISICSNLGGDVQYLVTNPEDGEEYFYDNIEDAEEKAESF